MYFETKVSGIPCICSVEHYRKEVYGVYSGPFENSYPDEPAEFEFHLLHQHAFVEKYLNSTISEEDEQRLLEEWESRND